MIQKYRLEIILIILSALYYCFFISHGIVLGDEGYYVHVSERVLDGEKLFKDIAVLHPPLFFYLLALSYKLFGISLIIGRILSFVFCVLIVSEVLYVLNLLKVKNFTKIASILGVTAFGYPLINIPVPIWPTIFLSILVVIAYIKWEQSNNFRNIFAIGVFLALIGVTKENIGAVFILITNLTIILNIKKEKLKNLILLNLPWVLTALFIFFYFFSGKLSNAHEFIVTTQNQIKVFPFSYPGISVLLSPLGVFKILPYYLPIVFIFYSFWQIFKDKKIDPLILISLFSGLGFAVLMFPTTDLIHVYPFLGLILTSLFLRFENSSKKKFIYPIIFVVIISGFYLTLFREYYRYYAPYRSQNVSLDFPRAKGIMTSKDLATSLEETNAFISKNTKKSDPIFVYPYSPMFYFLFERKNPTKYTSLLKGYYSDSEEEQIVQDLENSNLKYIIADGFQGSGSPLERFIKSQKLVFDKGFKVFEIQR